MTRFVAAVRRTLSEVGPAGVFPVLVLIGLHGVERFDLVAFGVLGPEIRDAFHLTNAEFIPLATMTAILPLIFSVPLGRLADNRDRVAVSRWGGLVWGLTSVAVGLAPAIGLLVVARLLGGIGNTVNEVAHPSLIADYYPPRSLATAMGTYRFGGAFFGLVAAPVAGAIGQIFGWRFTFVALALPTFIFVALTRRMVDPGRGASVGAEVINPQRVGFAEAFRQLSRVQSLRRTWWGAVLFGAGTVPFATYLSLFFSDVYHLSASARGVIGAILGVGGLVGLAIGGRVSQHRINTGRPEHLPLVTGGMIIEFAAGVVLMAIVPSVAFAVLVVTLLAIGVVGYMPAYQAMVALVVPPRLRSQAFAWSVMFFLFGAVVMSPLFGAIGDAHGQRAALIVLGIVTGAGGALQLTCSRYVQHDIRAAVTRAQAVETEALLVCRGIDAGYEGVQVLFGVDFEVREGEIVALLGTNGSGKSTLLKVISGLVPAWSGTVGFEGRDITRTDPRRIAERGIAHMPGGRGIFPTLTVAENLNVSSWMYRNDKRYLAEARAQVLEFFPVLKDRWHTAAGDLSGGEQQMLSLAAAFIARPKVLMIDELALGLAPVVVERLLDIVRAIHANGTAIVLVEQSVSTALKLAERAVFLEKGEVRFAGPTQDLLTRSDVLRAVYLHGTAAGLGDEGAPRKNGARSRSSAAAAARKFLGRPVVLEASGVSKRYGGITAVDLVDLELHEGEVLGLVGPNGAGKTTLFDLLSGHGSISGGRVKVFGRDATDWSAHQRALAGIGRSFQDARLFPGLTVRETIAVALAERHRAPGAVHALLCLADVRETEAYLVAEADEVIQLLGLTAFADKFTAELSTGSRRLVELAVMVAQRPKVLLLDEPSAGIAQREAEALGPVLRQVQRHLGCSILIIEHDMPLMRSVADRLVAMESGQVVTSGSADDVLSHPRVVASYLGEDATDLVPPQPRPRSRATSSAAGRTRSAEEGARVAARRQRASRNT
jgi:ABC-type branched-subunit amino acid transport system ATPase component/predicted MFS family arabinose efflux permease